MLNVKLLSHTQNPELLIATAAKLCYAGCTIDELQEKQTEEGIERFINLLASLGHESPLEHASFSFGVEGISRIVEIQLVRHRIASYSIQSGRYVKRDAPNFIKPENIKLCKPASKVFDLVAEQSAMAYNKIFLMLMLNQLKYSDEEIEEMDYDNMIDIVQKLYETDKKVYSKFEKIAIEDARYVHLQSLETKLVCTMNLRTLINFTRHRECNRAQLEIRNLSKEMQRIMNESFPLLGKMLGAPCRFGSCPEGKMCCGNPYPKIK